MLFQILTRMVERGETDGLREKLDVFFAVGGLTHTEYMELLELLKDTVKAVAEDEPEEEPEAEKPKTGKK